ncbi:MAG: hypothetical protein JSS23_12335 [Proteobacteria bacterium]|nr:hypothetical protein [Pseudomonadota bacterium]
MGKQSAPPQPVYQDSYAEGVKADAASIPVRLMAERASREGGKWVMGDDGMLTRVPVAPTLDPQYDAAWKASVAEGDQRNFRTWLGDHAMETGLKDETVQQYLNTPDAPQGKMMDFGGGDKSRIDQDIAAQTQLLTAGSKLAQDFETERLKQSLSLLPQFNDLNLDMQRKSYQAQLDAAKAGEQERLDMELGYRGKFTDSELAAQQKAWEQSLGQSKIGTKAIADIQAELMPQMNKLGIDSQAAAYLASLGLTSQSAEAADALYDRLGINKKTLADQQAAFDQNLAQNKQGAQQLTDLQRQLLPVLNSLGIDLTSAANAASRADSKTAALEQAGIQEQLLPLLNNLQLRMQGDAQSANDAADVRAFETNLGQNTKATNTAAGLTQQLNPLMAKLQRDNAADANAQSRSDAAAATAQQMALMERFNPAVQAMGMANQKQANTASLADASEAYRTGSALMRETGDQIAATNLARQVQADNLSQGQSENAMRRSASLQQELLPQLNETGLANQAAGRRAALESLKETDATRYNTREQLGAQVMGDLALGDQLSDAQRTRMQNQVRSAQAARGNVLGGAPAVQEMLAETDYQDRMKAQRQQAARDFINTGDLLPQFATLGTNDPTASFNVNRNIAASLQEDQAARLFNPQTGYQGAAVANPAMGYNAQTGVQTYGVADPMAAFDPNANTARGGQFGSMQVGNSAALYNPNSAHSAVGVNANLNQVAPNASAATRGNPQSMFTGAAISAAQPVNPLMPNFSAGGYSPNIPNFQATTTQGPQLNPMQLTQSNPFQFTNGQAGTNSANFAMQGYQQNSANVNAKNQQTGSMIGAGAGMMAMFM